MVNYIRSENITPECIFHKKPMAIATPLYNVGECVANLTPGFREEHSTVLGVKIAGLRQRLVHHYDGTNWMVICAIIYNVLLKFLEE